MRLIQKKSLIPQQKDLATNLESGSFLVSNKDLSGAITEEINMVIQVSIKPTSIGQS